MASPRTLAVDIGGTGVKLALLDDKGRIIGKSLRVPTPMPPVAPEALAATIDAAAAPLGQFDRASVGFPGMVRNGRVLTAPHLGTEVWAGFDLQQVLAERWKKPVRVMNDADVQGFGAIKGRGVEMVLTLGTGAGTALFEDGRVLPHLELAHHPIHGKKTYDEYIGNAALDRKGHKTWNKRVERAIGILRRVINFDHLYLGGGNAKHISFALRSDVTIVPNTDGLTGGIALWREAAETSSPSRERSSTSSPTATGSAASQTEVVNASLPSASRASASVASVRPAARTVAPSPSRRRQTASPIPVAPPVTSASLPANRRFNPA